MKKGLLLFLLSILILVGTALGYTGTGSIWVQPKGYFTPVNRPGDSTGFGQARDLCILRGGGIITMGPGTEGVVTTYPAGVGIIVVKQWITGWQVDPFSVTGLTFGTNNIIAIKSGGYAFEAYPGTQTGIDAALAYGGNGADIIVGPVSLASTATIRVLNDNVRITGVSDSSSLFINGAASGDTLFHVFGKNVTIQNIGIFGDKGIKSTGVGIVIDGEHALIEDCAFRDLNQKGIVLNSGADRTHIKDNHFSRIGDLGDVSSYAINVNSAPNLEIEGNTFIENASATINLLNSDYTSIKNNRFLTTLSNTIIAAGVKADSFTVGVSVVDNLFRDLRGYAVDVNSESTLVSNNRVFSCAGGVHEGVNFSVSLVEGNLIVNPTGFGIFLETLGVGVWGTTIRDNHIFYPGLGHMQLEAQLSNSGDWSITDNYLYGGDNPVYASIRIVSISGGTLDRLSITGNKSFHSPHSGIHILNTTPAGVAYFKDCSIKDNEFFYPTRYGIEIDDLSGGLPSEAYISGNTTTEAILGETLLSSGNWNYEATGEKTTYRGTRAVFEDSLRVGKAGSSAPLTVSGDTFLRNNKWTRYSNAAGVYNPIVRVDSVNNVIIQPITGGNVDIYHTNGTLATRFYGTAGMSVTNGGTYQLAGSNVLALAGNDTRTYNINGAGNWEIRNNSNTTSIISVSNTGNFTSLGKGIFTDSLRANLGIRTSRNIIVDPSGDRLTFNSPSANLIESSAGTLRLHVQGTTRLEANTTGVSISNGSLDVPAGKLTVADSLRVNKTTDLVGGTRIGPNTSISFWDGSNYRPAIFGADGANLRFNNLSAVEDIQFREFGDAQNNLTISNGGAVTARTSLTSQGSLSVATNGTITDSLRVIGKLDVGRKNGIPQRHTIGVGGSAAGDTATLVLNAGSNVGSVFSPKIELQRDGVAKGSISVGTTNLALNYNDTGFIQGFLLNDASHISPTFSFDSQGRLELGNGVPGWNLEVNGNALITDSLRVNKGLHLGGRFITKANWESATLDFDLTAVTVQDLTITVNGAVSGDMVFVGVPAGSVTTSVQYTGWVSAANTVTIRARTSAAGENPASGAFKVMVVQ